MDKTEKLQDLKDDIKNILSDVNDFIFWEFLKKRTAPSDYKNQIQIRHGWRFELEYSPTAMNPIPKKITIQYIGDSTENIWKDE